MQPAIAPSVVLKSVEELAVGYFEVCRCWNDHARSVRTNMSFEKASRILREVRDQAILQKNGRQLSAKAHNLLQDLIYKQDDEGQHEGG